MSAAQSTHFGGDKMMPIAIVGMGGRFPGDAANPEKLWELLSQGRSARSTIPNNRYNIDAFYHPHAERAGAQNFTTAHFMERDPDAFDAPFFQLTPNEVKAMDPQQRMCLEVAYEALENAGIPVEGIVKSQTAVFTGCFTADYKDMMSHDTDNLPAYFPTGVAPSCLSNRVSWFYDLRGPSMTVDTACSSSLIALHLACQAVRAGEAEMSLVGGVNFMCSPEYNYTMSALHFLTPDGKCKSFDSKGNGYARGEGCSFIVIKPLEQALKDNDVIRAVIRGTGANQDGKTPGITLPSTEAQAALIRNTYARAGLDLAETGYFEAHGTGTAAGDPIETAALGETIGNARPSDQPLWVGSIKANIGHLEGASGLAGLTKALFILEKGQIPPQVWLEKLNPRIQAEPWNLAFPRELTPWPYEGLRRVSINSFGFGGANAHCVLDDAYHYMKLRGLKGKHNTIAQDSGLSTPSELSYDSGVSVSASPTSEQDGDSMDDFFMIKQKLSSTAPKLLTISSHEQSGIARSTASITEYLKTELERVGAPEHSRILSDLAYSMGTRRSVLPWKTFAIASSLESVTEALAETPKPIRSSKVPKIGMVFTGQGAQHHAMGRELWAYPIFADSLAAADKYLASLGCAWSVVTELWKDSTTSNIDQAEFSQPLCTAVQVGLVELLRSFGVVPTAVVGHSSGEIAAAFTKGSLTREDAWLISYHRGRLSAMIKTLRSGNKGAMMAAGTDEATAAKYLARVTDGKAVVACVNSPSSVTISGDDSAIDQVEGFLKADNLFARKLKIETAYHSFHMEAISQQYFESLASLTPAQESADMPKMFSTVTGSLLQSSAFGAQYWVDNMLNTVRFAGGIDQLLQHSESKRRRANAKPFVDILVEIGPHGALQGPIKQILGERAKDVQVLSALSRGQDCAVTILNTVGRLFQSGYQVKLDVVNNSEARDQSLLPNLPPYPWNHSNKYWCETALAAGYRFRKQARNDLLGTRNPEQNAEETIWRHHFRLSENPWIEDHSVHNTLLYPAAGMMVMALEAASQIADQARPIDGYELKDVVVGKALIVPRDEEGVETMLHIRPWRSGSQAGTAPWKEFMIYSRRGQDDWSLNCSGLLRVTYEQETASTVFQDEMALKKAHHRKMYKHAKTESTTVQSSASFYNHQSKIGLQLGVTFRNLKEINKGDGMSACMVEIPDMASTMPMNYITNHVIHPCTLDAIIQTLLPTVEGRYESLKTAAIPTFIEKLFVSADTPSEPGAKFETYSIAGYTGLTEAEACVYASTDSWAKPLVTIERIRATRLASLSNGGDDSTNLQNLRKITGEFVWDKDISNMSFEQIVEHCKLTASPARDPNTCPTHQLERAAAIYARRALSVFPAEAAARLPEDRQKLYQALTSISQKSNMAGSPLDDNSFLSYIEKASSDGELLSKLGKALPDVLEGQTIPGFLVSKDGDAPADSLIGSGQGGAYAQLGSLLSLMGHNIPGMKILEIGCESAAVTSTIMKALAATDCSTTPWFKSFTCAGVAAQAPADVAALLATYPSLTEYKSLDLAKPAVQQGFKDGTYDLVIASNLTQHASSLESALDIAHKMLKPNGRLILGELSQHSTWYPLVFSLLGDGTFRETCSDDVWSGMLSKAGFQGVDYRLPEPSPSGPSVFSFMVATPSTASLATLPEKVLLVEAARQSEEAISLTDSLTSELRAAGVKVTAATLSEAAERSDLKDLACIMLAELQFPILFHLQPQEFHAIRNLVLNAASTTWVTRGGAIECKDPKMGLITGLSRTIRQESVSTKLSTLDLDPSTVIDSRANVGAIFSALRAHSLLDADSEFALRSGIMKTARLHLHKGANDLISTFYTEPKPEPGLFKQECRALTLTVETPGMLDSLHFADDVSYDLPLGEKEVEIEVMASGLNFMDIMVAMGQIQEPAIGLEAAGIVTRVGPTASKFKVGDRLMTWSLGCFSNYVRNDESMYQRIPASMSYSIAASLPMIYCTAYQSIVEEARLEKGEKILIHAAAGGVGQASIMIAQHIGAEIFATVGSQEKKAHIMKTFGISEDHIFNSRDLSFVQGIRRATNEGGVDVILNSLAGEALRESWSCLAWFGRFIELGKKDITENTGLEMAPFLRNQSFHAVNVIGTLRASVPRAARMFERTMRFYESAVCKPVTPVHVLPLGKLEDGFRSLQSGRNIGKIVFETESPAVVHAIPHKVRPAKYNPDVTYVLSGGLGGLGHTLSHRMVDLGAKNIAYLSRSGSSKPSAKAQIDELIAKGVNARAFTCDIGNAAQVQETVAKIQAEMPPIRGLIQAAMSLADAAYENMTPEQWTLSVNSKAPGTWNLHRYLPADLDFFVMLASSSGAAGNRGQANYAAGNTFQDALAHHRRSKGLSAVAIDVGPVLGAGHVAENTQLIESLAAQGYTALQEEEFVGLIQAGITGVTVTGEPTPAQLVTGFATGALIAAEKRDVPDYLTDAKMRHILLVDMAGQAADDSSAGAGLGTQVANVTSVSAGADLVVGALAQKLAKLMMVSADDIDTGKPISTYGVDSLTAVEIRTWCFKELHSDISIFDIMSNIPIASLGRIMVSRSKLVDAAVVAADV